MKRFNYETKTLMWENFSVLEQESNAAIKTFYNEVFEEVKNDYICLTELVIVLNWKGWDHYEENRMNTANLYFDLFREAQEYAFENLTGSELTYFIRTTD